MIIIYLKEICDNAEANLDWWLTGITKSTFPDPVRLNSKEIDEDKDKLNYIKKRRRNY